MKSDSIDNPTVRQLLSLVRASLWGNVADTRPFTDAPVPWDDIGRLAMLQTVAPLAIEGTSTLPPDLRPPREWQLKGYALVERNRRTHRLLDNCVAEIFPRLATEGLSPVLLKGQAYAGAYPDPVLRQCGDIDIYVGEEGYRRGYEASLRWGCQSDVKFDPEEKHYSFSFKGVKVELHRTPAILVTPGADRRFREWSATQLRRGDTAGIGGMEVEVPTPVFDVVFVFVHLYHHFIHGGVGLRQLCDWTMLLHAHAGKIDRQELQKLLDDIGHLKAWRLFAPIAVDVLGLPPEECPLYSPEYGGKAHIIMEFIIREGNFGRGVVRASNRPKGYVLGKAYSFMQFSRRLYSKFRIDPTTIIYYHAAFFIQGMRRMLRPPKSPE